MCHQCQICLLNRVIVPPVVTLLALLFQKAYIDTMHLPTAHGYSYVVQAYCSLLAWPKWHMLQTEITCNLGVFIFKEILCYWGRLAEIVTDNGTPFVAVLDWLVDHYHIRHIRTSAYNSQVNGIVE